MAEPPYPAEMIIGNERRWYQYGMAHGAIRMESMATIISIPHRTGLVFLIIAVLLVGPVHAFTANSLDITVDKTGDAIAVFQFSLDGIVENAIPQSMLEEQLLKGMGTSSDPPSLISMDRSSATIRMKKFADTSDVPTGTEYRTASMDFKKAEIALQNSGLSSVISADFTPSKIVVHFPDSFKREFSSSDTLPSITHTVIDPTKHPAVPNGTSSVVPSQPVNGAIKVISSPSGVQVSLDGQFVGTAPDTFSDIPAGTHTLQFSKENYAPVSKTVTVKAGEVIRMSVYLEYIESTPKPSPGFTGILTGIALGICLLVVVTRKNIPVIRTP
jgi:hypothetical protein